MSDSVSEDRVREQLKQVIDPELFVNIVDLGLIYVVDVAPSEEAPDKTDVKIEMTMPRLMVTANPRMAPTPTTNRISILIRVVRLASMMVV